MRSRLSRIASAFWLLWRYAVARRCSLVALLAGVGLGVAGVLCAQTAFRRPPDDSPIVVSGTTWKADRSDGTCAEVQLRPDGTVRVAWAAAGEAVEGFWAMADGSVIFRAGPLTWTGRPQRGCIQGHVFNPSTGENWNWSAVGVPRDGGAREEPRGVPR